MLFGIPPSTTVDSLRSALLPYGYSIVEVRVPLSHSGETRGFAFVDYASVDDAVAVRDFKSERW